MDRFKGTDAKEMESYGLMKRVLHEQCHVGRHKHGRPEDDDDDAGEGKVPIALKDPKHIAPGSLQSPHDPDVTYNGHKGQGYEVQVAETCGEDDPVRVITHVEVTPSSGSDANFTLPLLEALAERSIQPEELWADTAYGSGHNAFEAEREGTELVSPVGGTAPAEPEPEETPRLSSGDFEIDATGNEPTVCPAGHEAIAEYEDEDRPERVEIYFAQTACTPCSLRER
ncbi:MAG TPA: hypothetical protein VKA63_07055, partial [Candidatus Krumholzibacteria bacterium]|nr:hypothetical protein [Candidatus Krumholzibacteria bacterium]